MKQFLNLLDGMMEYRQLKDAIEQGRVPVSLTGAAAAHKIHIIASLCGQLQRPALVVVFLCGIAVIGVQFLIAAGLLPEVG